MTTHTNPDLMAELAKILGSKKPGRKKSNHENGNVKCVLGSDLEIDSLLTVPAGAEVVFFHPVEHAPKHDTLCVMFIRNEGVRVSQIKIFGDGRYSNQDLTKRGQSKYEFLGL